MILVIDLQKAKRGERKAGAKYLDRTWDVRAGRWRYSYTRPTVHGPATPQAGQLSLFDVPHASPAPVARPRETKAARLLHKAEQAIEQFELSVRSEPLEYLCVVDPRTGKETIRRGGTHPDMVEVSDIPEDQLRGMIISHNHPSGRSFSEPDIHLAIHIGGASMRVTGLRYRYRMDISTTITETDKGRMLYTIAKLEHDLFSEFNRLIREKRMSIPEANERHHHELWTRFAAEFPDHVTYTRTPWYDAAEQPFGATPMRGG